MSLCCNHHFGAEVRRRFGIQRVFLFSLLPGSGMAAQSALADSLREHLSLDSLRTVFGDGVGGTPVAAGRRPRAQSITGS